MKNDKTFTFSLSIYKMYCWCIFIILLIIYFVASCILWPKCHVKFLKNTILIDITRLNSQAAIVDVKREQNKTTNLETTSGKILADINSDKETLIGLLSMLHENNAQDIEKSLMEVDKKISDRELEIMNL